MKGKGLGAGGVSQGVLGVLKERITPYGRVFEREENQTD